MNKVAKVAKVANENPQNIADGAQDLMLTPRQLAERLSLHPGTLVRWRAASLGPRYMKIHKHCYYRLSDVISWEDRHRVEVEPPDKERQMELLACALDRNARDLFVA